VSAPEWEIAMAEALTSVRIHLLWGTHKRRPWLDPEWRPRLFAQISALADRRAARVVCAGGTRDHIHLYLDHPPSISLADLVHLIKAGTSRWIHASYPHRREFKWQSGYAAFSVTPREDGAVQAYIREQEVHHRERAFYSEYVGLLEGHGVAYDIHRLMD
jgi:REP element-mobilizing transposase RayT